MSDPVNTAFETRLERGLFASRWLMAPIYVGLALSMLLLVYVFAVEFWHLVVKLPGLDANGVILGVLALIDLSLAGNLLLIVIFSGYENFVSKFDIDKHEDRPEWQGTVDFSTLKLKLIASIVAISGIHLLKVFMEVGKSDPEHIRWMVIIHVVFVLSGAVMALTDYLTAQSKKLKKPL